MYNLKESMGHLLAVSHWKLHQMLIKRFRESGLDVTPDQWKVMVILLNRGPIYQSQIALSIIKDRAGVKRLIDQLEKKAMVVRRASERDARTHWVELTPRGKEVVEKLNRLAKENLAEAFGSYDPSEIETTKKVLNSFIEQFEKQG